ncbi:MAG: hypothetical protein WC647_11405 [Desulfomonilaceae bacterium]|jgi:hypothetical protein
MGKSPFKKAIVYIIFIFALSAVGWSHARAQYYDFGLGSMLPLKSIESVFGPLLPPNGFGDTFRSELGIDLATPMFQKILLSGNGVTHDLLNNHADDNGGLTEPVVYVRSLDGGPIVYDFFAKFRVWRFAAKADYSIFEARSRGRHFDGFFFNAVILSGDIDVIQGPWLTAGVATKWSLNSPFFRFNNFPTKYSDPKGNTNIYFESTAPATIGAYIRYVPPEILGFPVHFEAWADFPLKGSPWTSVGAALVFRPQIYRFDLFSRLKYERTTLSISGSNTDTSNAGASLLPTFGQTWDLNLNWALYGMEFGIFF